MSWGVYKPSGHDHNTPARGEHYILHYILKSPLCPSLSPSWDIDIPGMSHPSACNFVIHLTYKDLCFLTSSNHEPSYDTCSWFRMCESNLIMITALSYVSWMHTHAWSVQTSLTAPTESMELQVYFAAHYSWLVDWWEFLKKITQDRDNVILGVEVATHTRTHPSLVAVAARRSYKALHLICHISSM